MTETIVRTHLTNESLTAPDELQPIDGYVCPPWCLGGHDPADVLQFEGVSHEGAPIEWTTARGSEMSAKLVWFELLGKDTYESICYGAYIEIDGDDNSGFVQPGEFDIQDALTVAQVFAELSTAAGYSFTVSA